MLGKVIGTLWEFGKRGVRSYMLTKIWEYARTEGCVNASGEIDAFRLASAVYDHAKQAGAAAREIALTMARILAWWAFCAIGVSARIAVLIVDTTCPDGPTGYTRYRIRQIAPNLPPYETGREVARILRDAANDTMDGRRYEVVDEDTGEAL